MPRSMARRRPRRLARRRPAPASPRGGEDAAWPAAERAALHVLDTRHSVAVEDGVDLRAAALDDLLELVVQPLIAAACAHRDVEDEREEGEIDLRMDRSDVERHGGA